MKLFLCAGVFLCFLCLGYFIYKGYRLRKQFFESLLFFCNHLLVEINFSKNTVLSVIDTYKASYSPQFARVLDGYCGILQSKGDITRENLLAVMWNKLKPAESSAVVDFFFELGRHGATEECGKIKNKQVIFQSLNDDAVGSLKREASIYFKLCIFLGIGVVILLL